MQRWQGPLRLEAESRIVMSIGKSPASGHGTVSMRSQKRMLEYWALKTLKTQFLARKIDSPSINI